MVGAEEVLEGRDLRRVDADVDGGGREMNHGTDGAAGAGGVGNGEQGWQLGLRGVERGRSEYTKDCGNEDDADHLDQFYGRGDRRGSRAAG